MGNLQYIPSFYFYKFAHAVSEPYTNLTAYRSGLIDEQGNLKGNESSIDPFEYFVIKIKKIFEQLPPGITKYKTGNLFGVMQLFGEEAKQFGLENEDLEILLEAELLTKQLNEDMGTSAVPGGIGTPAEAPNTNQGNVSGYDPRMNTMLTRSNPTNMFSAVEMFNIPSNEFKMFKFSKYYPKTSTGNYLRRFGHRNANTKIAVKDEETGEVYWLPNAKKKTIAEEFNLNLLNEQKGESDWNLAGEAILKPFNRETVNRVKSGTISQDDAENYARASVFFSSLGNVTQKLTDPFLSKTMQTARKKVSDTSEDGWGIDENGKLFSFNGKNGRASYGTRGVESIGFPQRKIENFYDLKRAESETTNQREIKKIKREMSKIRDWTREWESSEPRQKAIRGLIAKHVEELEEPTVAVTPFDVPLLIPHGGIVKHIMNQPGVIKLGRMGQGGRPEPQAQIGGSELARSNKGMQTLLKNIKTNPRKMVPGRDDIQFGQKVFSDEIFNRFRNLLNF